MTPQQNQDDGPKHAPMGQLYGPDGSTVRVGITHREEDILLVVLDEPGTLYDQPLAGLILESTGGRGVLRTPGTGQRVDINLIRFFLDDAADVVQRREFVRVTAVQRVVFVDEDDNVIADTYTVNMSGGGMLVKRPPTAVMEGDMDTPRVTGPVARHRELGVPLIPKRMIGSPTASTPPTGSARA